MQVAQEEPAGQTLVEGDGRFHVDAAQLRVQELVARERIVALPGRHDDRVHVVRAEDLLELVDGAEHRVARDALRQEVVGEEADQLDTRIRLRGEKSAIATPRSSAPTIRTRLPGRRIVVAERNAKRPASSSGK